MVTVFSNTNSEPACLVSRLKFGNDNNVDNVQFQRLGWLIPQRGKKINFLKNGFSTVRYLKTSFSSAERARKPKAALGA